MKKSALQTIKEIELLILDCREDDKETLSKYLRNALQYLNDDLAWTERMRKEKEGE